MWTDSETVKTSVSLAETVIAGLVTRTGAVVVTIAALVAAIVLTPEAVTAVIVTPTLRLADIRRRRAIRWGRAVRRTHRSIGTWRKLHTGVAELALWRPGPLIEISLEVGTTEQHDREYEELHHSPPTKREDARPRAS